MKISIASCRLSDEEIAAAIAVMRSGRLVRGPETLAFERAFASLTGARHAVACSSGTAALHLAYSQMLRPGDEVLVPAMTFCATASMLLVVGAVPVICDIDPDTWLIDLADAAKRVTDRTKGIVPVHLFGNPCDPATVNEFAERHGLAVIWDAAQAHGARMNGSDVGTFGLVCYSLYATKTLFVGEGGLVCTDDANIAGDLRRRRNHGMEVDGRVSLLGFNYRLPELHAAIGRRQLDRFAAMWDARRHNAARLRRGLSGVAGIVPQRITPQGESAWQQFCVRIVSEKYGIGRDRLATVLGALEIESIVYYRHGLNRQPLFQGGGIEASLPHADRLADEVLAIPVHHDLSEADIDRIVEGVSTAPGCSAARDAS